MRLSCLIAAMLVVTALPVRAEIRQVAGKHLVLYTDLPPNAEIDALPALFDQAFVQWCEYFRVDPDDHKDWRPTGVLMQGPESRPHFIAAKLMPADMWDFKSGYSQGLKLWLYDQTSPYYRRHLLLHEGVHSFMGSILGSTGPPWYAEGMAELLATHKLKDGQLTVNYFPRSTREVPKLGRVEMVRASVADGRNLSLPQISQYGDTAHRQNEPYGWCWAAAAFLDGHPRYRNRFRDLAKHVASPDFQSLVTKRFALDDKMLAEEWQIFVANLDYGYDFERSQLKLAIGKSPAVDGTKVEVAADRGWQSSGVRLQAGKKYRISASGRYQIASDQQVWWCEPGGVSIRYVQGKPLGMLLGAVRTDALDASKRATPLAKPQAIGLQTTFTPEVSGTLYLRVNDAPGELADNAGQISVTIAVE